MKCFYEKEVFKMRQRLADFIKNQSGTKPLTEGNPIFVTVEYCTGFITGGIYGRCRCSCGYRSGTGYFRVCLSAVYAA